MEMSRLITGWALILFGIGLFIIILFNLEVWPILIYSVLALIIGVLILVNAGKEEKIETIKLKRSKK